MSPQFDPATPRQKVTSAAADIAIVNTAGIAVALLVRLATGQDSYAPVLVWLALALLLHATNGIWLTGRSGQSLGDRIARVACLSPATGRPVGVNTLARASAAGADRDPRVMRVSLAPAHPDRRRDG